MKPNDELIDLPVQGPANYDPQTDDTQTNPAREKHETRYPYSRAATHRMLPTSYIVHHNNHNII